MICIDDRIGSVELRSHIEGSELTRLEFADVVFDGNGPNGPCFIGIERKRIWDFLGSMLSGRLQNHQIIGLLDAYDYNYVIVEGIWRSGNEGILQYRSGQSWKDLALGRRTFMARDVWMLMNNLSILFGIPIWQSQGIKQTVEIIMALIRWWSKPFERHGTVQFSKDMHGKLLRPNAIQRVAAQLPGIGAKLSGSVAAHFGSIAAMVEGEESDWKAIEGVGKKTATNVMEVLHHEF